MKKLTMTAAFFAIALPALASGDHAGGHHGEMAIGEPGRKAEVSETITVVMKETDDGEMIFEPSSIAVKEGQTIAFEVQNAGENDHEFVLDSHEEIMEHKALMEKFPEMEHDDPNAIRLEAGQSGEIVWKFTNSGTFTFACLIPGHYDAGMHGELNVSH